MPNVRTSPSLIANPSNTISTAPARSDPLISAPMRGFGQPSTVPLMHRVSSLFLGFDHCDCLQGRARHGFADCPIGSTPNSS
jgi:hypothetical protein